MHTKKSSRLTLTQEWNNNKAAPVISTTPVSNTNIQSPSSHKNNRNKFNSIEVNQDVSTESGDSHIRSIGNEFNRLKDGVVELRQAILDEDKTNLWKYLVRMIHAISSYTTLVTRPTSTELEQD